ncbi:hypothetical protein NE237_024512 [Protea cynaroides]|uniref:Pirin N-terminal domain-containing protein n=1 Tax=Protea cynaroides TaxID=273540 RepID=A0A9Q0H2D9_9MAGN|nr:hypothetical protein NE237_024512 [Protea cynaroides]
MELRHLDPFLLLDEFVGNKGTISTGDVQWMTVGRGIVHSEMLVSEGINRGLYLWINLASNNKMLIQFGVNTEAWESDYDGDRFITIQDGVWKVTPLLLTVAVIELSDIAFAVDSIPAVLGVTRDPFIVLTSNLFAILGYHVSTEVSLGCVATCLGGGVLLSLMRKFE